jgi:hypothetical protein
MLSRQDCNTLKDSHYERLCHEGPTRQGTTTELHHQAAERPKLTREGSTCTACCKPAANGLPTSCTPWPRAPAQPWAARLAPGEDGCDVPELVMLTRLFRVCCMLRSALTCCPAAAETGSCSCFAAAATGGGCTKGICCCCAAAVQSLQ